MKKNNIKSVNLLYLLDVVFIVIGFTLLVTLLGLLCLPFKSLGIEYEEVTHQFIEMVNNNQILAMIISQLLIFAPAVVFFFKKKEFVKGIIRFNAMDLKTILWLIVLTYALMPVMTFINMLSMLFVENKISNTIDKLVNDNSIVVAIICVAMLPAFVEEFLCRGIIYNTHAKVNVKKAIIINGILFGLLHCNFNQFAYAFFMGMVFAMVVEVTNTTLSTMLMHFIVNCNSIVIAYISILTGEQISFEEEVEYTLPQVMSWGVFAAFSLIIAVLVYKKIAIHNKRWDYINKELFFNKKNSSLAVKKEDSIYIEEKMEEKDLDIQNNVSKDEKYKFEIYDIHLTVATIVCVIYMIITEVM